MATSIKLDDALKARVDRIAQARNRSAHWIMLEAIRTFVEQAERDQSYHQGGAPAWSGFQGDARVMMTSPQPYDVSSMRAVVGVPAGGGADEAYQRFMALGVESRIIGPGRSAEEIDRHIRWLRDDD